MNCAICRRVSDDVCCPKCSAEFAADVQRIAAAVTDLLQSTNSAAFLEGLRVAIKVAGVMQNDPVLMVVEGLLHTTIQATAAKVAVMYGVARPTTDAELPLED